MLRVKRTLRVGMGDTQGVYLVCFTSKTLITRDVMVAFNWKTVLKDNLWKL